MASLELCRGDPAEPGMPPPLGGRGETMQITIFEAAMAPQIGASIVAFEHDLDPPLVTLMVGIGLPLSFLSLPIWWLLLEALA